MPRKKLRGGNKNSKRKSDQKAETIIHIETKNDDEPFMRLKTWIENVNKNKDDFQIKDEVEEIEENSEDEEEFECNLKELEKPLRTLLRKLSDYQIKRFIKLECEFGKCSFETLEERTYFNHVNDHLMDIVKNEEMICKWDLCEYSTKNSDEFIRHLHYHAYHTTLKTFGYGLSQVVSLPICQGDSRLRNVIPELKNNYFCYWLGCNESYLIFTEYIDHVNHHISEYSTGSPWKGPNQVKVKDIRVVCHWEGCERTIANVFELKRHLRVHTQQKAIACPNCGHTFSTKLLLINHLVRQVVGQRTFKCPECTKFYPSEKLLKDHVRSHVNKFQCSLCGLSCQKRSVLARHIRYRHIKTKLFACDKCSYKGTTQADLDSHSNRHKEGSFFKCDVFQCNYSCRTLMALKRHDAREHLGQALPTYVCHICTKKFLRGYLLTKHLKADHDFILAPGHSRFIYKLDNDGFYRLQTRRVENLTEPTFLSTANADNVKKVEIEMIENSSDNLTFQVKPCGKYSKAGTSKDINEFAIVKNYKKILKKK